MTRERNFIKKHLAGNTRHIAFVTLGELYQWLFLRPFSETNRQRLLDHIAGHVVLPFDRELIWIWAELTAGFRQSGRGMSEPDSWIAATAIRHDLPLITHNRRHFEGIPGITIISES